MTSPQVRQGDRVFVNVAYAGANSSTYYFLDYTTNSYTSVSSYTPNVDLSSAEAVNELIPYNGGYLYFGGLEFFAPEAYGTWGKNYQLAKLLSDNVTLSEFTAYKDSTLSKKIASPGGVDGSGNYIDYATGNDTC